MIEQGDGREKRKDDEMTMEPVIKRMQSITVKDIEGFKGNFDPNAGIEVIPLSGGKFKPIEIMVGTERLSYNFYVAKVGPGQAVNSHFHKHGREPYVFLDPTAGGDMYRGHVENVKGEEGVQWHGKESVSQGSIVNIAEGEVHSFHNTTDHDVYFLFCCPGNHLVDHDEAIDPADNPRKNRDGDRYIVKDLPGGDRTGAIVDKRI